MDDFDQFERSLAAALRSDADMSVARFESASIAAAALAGAPRRSVRLPWRFTVRPASNRWAVAAAAVIGVLLVGGAILLIQRSQPSVVVGPSPTSSAAPSTSLPAIVAPSPTPSGPPAEPTSSAVPNPAGAWTATGTMGTPRSDHTAVRLLDGRVLVVGGSGGPSDPDTAELYDPKSGTWTATGNMLKSLEGTPATLLRDGRVLVVDVDDSDADEPIFGAEVYDPESGTWTATGRRDSDGSATATLLRDGTVLVRDDTGSELYDPATGTWTATGKMIDPRHSHTAILLPDGRVLVAGGHVTGDTPTDSAELYDPDTGAWTAAANMHAPREAIEAFLQPDGKVLVVGGSNRGDPQSAELYDPATGAWTSTGDVSRGGAGETLTLLTDGTVLMAGGGNAGDAAEVYDPSTGSWTTVAPKLRSHGTSAVLLLDGTVLVAGGNDCLDGNCVATGAAELYVPAGVSPPSLPAFPSPPPPVFPSPTPDPTPFPPEAGPVPPNARTWTVTAVNRSSDPATLFVAEEDENGLLGPLVGSVSPNVVPPGATVQVTFLLPARGDGWSIFVNPGPDEGPLLLASDVPLPGEIRITEFGQVGWLSP